MTAEQLALSVSDTIRQQEGVDNETRLGLAQLGPIRSVSTRDKIDDIKSLALDLASLFVIGVHRDVEIIVYFPNARLCRRILMFVYEGVSRILRHYPQSGRITAYNILELIEFSPAAGFANRISAYPTKPAFLRAVHDSDLIVRATGNAEFDEAFEAFATSCAARSVVDVDFTDRRSSAVDALARSVIAMDISPIE